MLDRDFDRGWAHICVDMQSIFAEDTHWHAPWLNRVLPAIERLVESSAERTIFTRFLPPSVPEEAQGAWQRYYEHWIDMTRDRLPPALLDLVPPLARFVPPAQTFDKPVYSPWLRGDLHRFLQSRGIKTLIVSGGETDVCVLATVLGAIDLGYHVVLPEDALFGSADETHVAMLSIYRSRFQMQLSVTSVEDILDLWREQRR
ncbi:MAG: cysteine hydrolase [Burkholderiales bacterium]|nr:MAG: cysteine hydrolase [Burkholderiales bacterium]